MSLNSLIETGRPKSSTKDCPSVALAGTVDSLAGCLVELAAALSAEAVEVRVRAGAVVFETTELCKVYPLLVEAGFEAVRVSPRMVYVDASRPALVDGFTRKTFTAMIEG